MSAAPDPNAALGNALPKPHPSGPLTRSLRDGFGVRSLRFAPGECGTRCARQPLRRPTPDHAAARFGLVAENQRPPSSQAPMGPARTGHRALARPPIRSAGAAGHPSTYHGSALFERNRAPHNPTRSRVGRAGITLPMQALWYSGVIVVNNGSSTMARARAQQPERKTPPLKGPRSLDASIDAVHQTYSVCAGTWAKKSSVRVQWHRPGDGRGRKKVNAGLDALRALAGAAEDMSSLCALVERQQKRLATDAAETDSDTTGPETLHPTGSAPAPQVPATTSPQPPQTQTTQRYPAR